MLKCQRGASLLEILVALMLFGAGITLAMRTLPESTTATSRGRNITKATNLAQEKLEELMSLEYSDADLNAGTHADPDNPIDQHFRRRWQVQDNVPVVDMKRVDVTVTFDTGSADSTATVGTYITSRR